MISKFITIPRNVQILTRCTSIAQFATKRELPEKPQKSQRLESSTNSRTHTSRGNIRNYLTTKEPLPEYPVIEGIKRLELESFLASNFRQVKYGDYEFVECKEGYVQVYAKGWVDTRDVSNPMASYGVCYGELDHPLNSNGLVVGKQTEQHACLYGVAQALKSLPKDLFTKVCICTDHMRVISVMSYLLPQWVDNNFQTLSDPSLRCDNVPTLNELNEYVRLNPFIYRFKYTPSDCYIRMMSNATKLAKNAIWE